MRCHGQYINDRVCDLCLETRACKEEYEKREKVRKEQADLDAKSIFCPQRVRRCINDWQFVEMCNRNGKAYDDNCPNYCKPTKECEKYFKEED